MEKGRKRENISEYKRDGRRRRGNEVGREGQSASKRAHTAFGIHTLSRDVYRRDTRTHATHWSRSRSSFPFCPCGCSVFPGTVARGAPTPAGRCARNLSVGEKDVHRRSHGVTSIALPKEEERVSPGAWRGGTRNTHAGRTDGERASTRYQGETEMDRAESTEQRTGNRDTEHRTTTGHTRHRRTHHSRERVTRDYHGITGTHVRLRSYPDISAAPFVSFSP